MGFDHVRVVVKSSGRAGIMINVEGQRGPSDAAAYVYLFPTNAPSRVHLILPLF